jgi:hypothetical protein
MSDELKQKLKDEGYELFFTDTHDGYQIIVFKKKIEEK